MKKVRIIPRLDIKGPNLVKGIHLEGLRVLGDPSDFAKHYYNQGADEIFLMDVVASLYERNSLSDIIEKTAKSVFIPITVGGGIRSLKDIRNILRCGADKVSINTAAVKDPKFIERAVKEYGSSTISVAIESIKNINGEYFAFTDNGREQTSLNVKDWALKIADLGAGEIILTSVDRDGTGKGFDFELIYEIVKLVSTPVIVHGGAGEISHIIEILEKIDVDGVAIASALHYNTIQNFRSEINKDEKGNIDFLLKNKKNKLINDFSIAELKEKLELNNIPCRR